MTTHLQRSPECSRVRPLALRVPPIALAYVMGLLGILTLPAAVLYVIVSNDKVTLGLPAFLGYAFSGVMWFYSRRTATLRWTWILVALGLVAVIVVSFVPVSAFALAAYDEWKETQPGGRGYQP